MTPTGENEASSPLQPKTDVREEGKVSTGVPTQPGGDRSGPQIHGAGEPTVDRIGRSDGLLVSGVWLVAISLVLLALYLGWRSGVIPVFASAPVQVENKPVQNALRAESDPALKETPVFMQESLLNEAVIRLSNLHTIIPTRPREEVITYTVGTGDSVFGIAKSFNLKPETVLWANYDKLKDSPDMLSPGMVLNIPPVDGVYYQWREGNTIEGVAQEFKAKAEDILRWPGNHLDLTSPTVEPGQSVLIPGGKREFVQWIIPTIPRGRAGVSRSVYGQGACEGGYDGALGTGFFVWPSGNHFLSGNDYWSGHLGIDIAGATGDGIFAADSGVVVFAGWATGGYGFMIMIDHGNGYQTLYAHLSQVSVRCGQSVSKGGYIGAMGSTGNSTGSHLHFEVRYNGGFVNPWTQLPPP